MKNVLIVYGSTNGNIELVAGLMGSSMQKSGFDVTVKNVTDTKAMSLT